MKCVREREVCLHGMRQNRQWGWVQFPTKQCGKYSRRGSVRGEWSGRFWGGTGTRILWATPSSPPLLILSPPALVFQPIILSACIRPSLIITTSYHKSHETVSSIYIIKLQRCWTKNNIVLVFVSRSMPKMILYSIKQNI